MIKKYPYTDFNEYNLDWIIKEIKDLHKEWSDFEILNTIRFAGLWDITKQYPAWSLVTDNNIGYISVQPVPAGVDITETDYWKEVYNYDAVIPDIMQRIVDLEDQVDDFLLISRFPGDTDAEKVQNAFDYSKDHYNTALIVDREFDLTGSTIDLDKGLYISNADYLRYRSKTVFIGIAGGKFVKKDSGFFFTASTLSGDFLFDHVAFEGDVILDNINDHDNKAAGNSVFDCSKLIRITTENCSFVLIGKVYDGTLSIDNSTCMQTLISTNDLCTYSGEFMQLGQLYDVKLIGTTIENCNAGLYFDHTENVARNITLLTIDNCCIEDCVDGAIYITDNGTRQISINSIHVSGCYFEGNGSSYIVLNANLSRAVIESCKVAFLNDGEKFIDYRARFEKALYIAEISATGGGAGCYIAYGHADTTTYEPATLSDCAAISGSIINDPKYGINQNIYGTEYVRLSAAASNITDANNVAQKAFRGTLYLTATDTITNIPTGAATGILLWFGDSANSLQFFISQDLHKTYKRSRFSGYGWLAWAEL